MKLTKEKFAIYRKYRGDIDMWTRAATKSEREEMADADWSQMWALLQQLQLAQNGLASVELAATANQMLSEATSDDSLRRAILAYSKSGE